MKLVAKHCQCRSIDGCVCWELLHTRTRKHLFIDILSLVGIGFPFCVQTYNCVRFYELHYCIQMRFIHAQRNTQRTTQIVWIPLSVRHIVNSLILPITYQQQQQQQRRRIGKVEFNFNWSQLHTELNVDKRRISCATRYNCRRRLCRKISPVEPKDEPDRCQSLARVYVKCTHFTRFLRLIIAVIIGFVNKLSHFSLHHTSHQTPVIQSPVHLLLNLNGNEWRRRLF